MVMIHRIQEKRVRKMKKKWANWSFAIAFISITLPRITAHASPENKSRPPPALDDYGLALSKALLFFNAQKSGRLAKNNGINWRGDSGLSDGKGGLVGGYYDGGENTKFHFPMSFAMTMLSWSVIEYSHKYQTIDEYNHTRELIKWGTDYLLLTFNSTSTTTDQIYAQVGGSRDGISEPDDRYCWQRPEDMDYPRPVQIIDSGSDLAGEMAAALAAASIVFRDDSAYAKKLIKGAEVMFAFARAPGRRRPYCRWNPYIEPYYNSTGYYDEYLWSATWLYYATGNNRYLLFATNPGIARHSKAFTLTPERIALSWDNKVPAAMLLLTRFHIFFSPGYPYEDLLKMYHSATSLIMCSYLRQFRVFNWTQGGMIQLTHGKRQPLQYITNAAFLATLYADYMNAAGEGVFNCSSFTFPLDVLRSFATSQMEYILGKNPMNMSYVVGHGKKFPRHVHHRGASIPDDNKKYSCTRGWEWRDTSNPNPYDVVGAMVGGPDSSDHFQDVRTNRNYNEPTLAGNAGLVAALVSMTSNGGRGIDKNSMFSVIPSNLAKKSPPPPN